MKQVLPFAMLAVIFVSPAQAERKVIVIDADKLAPPTLRADEPVPGKWWLNRNATDWGASRGTILMMALEFMNRRSLSAILTSAEPSALPAGSMIPPDPAAHRKTDSRFVDR